MLENSKKQSSLLNLNQLVFKKYRILKLISEGNFGQIYLTVNEKDKKFYAMKIENKDSNVKILEQEAYYLYSIKGIGIPEFITFGIVKNNNVLIEELLGKTLLDLFIVNNYTFSIKDICLIALQLIDRIELLHTKTLIHRDIKPDNCMIGLENPNIIYLTNFGLATKYCSSKTRKHILPKFKGTFTGTLKFCSANAQRGNQLSRRDDLESLAYTILYFMKGKLPWEHLSQKFNEKEVYLKTYAMKKYMPIKPLCKGCPVEFEDFVKYVRDLKFQEEPNYDYLRKIFETILENNNFENIENLNFSWVEGHQSNKLNMKKKRGLSPKSRLYQQIKSQLEIKNEIKSDHNYIVRNMLSNKIQNNIDNNINQSVSLTKLNKKKINNEYELSKKNQDYFLPHDYEKVNANNEIDNIINTDRKEKEINFSKFNIKKEKNKQYLYDNKIINYTQINDNLNKNNFFNKKELEMDKINNISNIDNSQIIIKKVNSKANNNNSYHYSPLYTDKNKYNKNNNKFFINNKINLNKNTIPNMNKKDIIIESKKGKNINNYIYNKNKDYMIADKNINDPNFYYKKLNNNIKSKSLGKKNF